MKIGIYGLGIMGGSLGRAIKKYTDCSVFGFDISESVMQKALLLDAMDERLSDENVGEMDLLVFALCPRDACREMERLCKSLKKGATVTDICGNKRVMYEKMEALQAAFPDLSFVSVHPMAGKEFSGISHSSATLFSHAYFILTPVHTPIEPLASLKSLFMSLGAEGIVVSTPEEHDRIIAYTSQLAHVVSSAYIKNPISGEYLGFSAGSFRDMTRVARLSPAMWAELFVENKDNLVGQIDDLILHLTEYREAIASGDEEKLRALLQIGTDMKERAEQMRREGRSD